MKTWLDALLRRPAPRLGDGPLRLSIAIVVEPDDDGFHAYCPALKGLHVGAQTEQELLDHLNHALTLYLASLARHGDPLPVGPHLSVCRPEPLPVPAGATLRQMVVQWPSHATSGTR